MRFGVEVDPVGPAACAVGLEETEGVTARTLVAGLGAGTVFAGLGFFEVACDVDVVGVELG